MSAKPGFNRLIERVMKGAGRAEEFAEAKEEMLCPHPGCRSERILLDSHESEGANEWWVVCGDCGLRGPVGTSINSAFIKWGAMPRGEKKGGENDKGFEAMSESRVENGLTKLCIALYGRDKKAQDLVGSDARVFHDAARAIESHKRSQVLEDAVKGFVSDHGACMDSTGDSSLCCNRECNYCNMARAIGCRNEVEG